MTTTLRATFDGKVFVPEGPVDVPAGVSLTLTVVNSAVEPPLPPRMTLNELNAWVKANPPDLQAVKELKEYIDQEFSKVDPRDW